MIIEKIFWKRTYLIVDYTSDEECQLAIRHKKSGRLVEFDTRLLKDNMYRGKLNITIANGRRVLEKGTWEIVEKNSGKVVENYAQCIYDNLDKIQRIFRYTARYYANIYTLDYKEGQLVINNSYLRPIDKHMTTDQFGGEFFGSYKYKNETKEIIDPVFTEDDIVPDVKITDLIWNDGVLTVKYDSVDNLKLVGYYKKERLVKKLDCHIENTKGEVRIPVCDYESKEMIDRGAWRLCVEDTLYPVQLSDELLLNIEHYNRSFFSPNLNYAISACVLVQDYSGLNCQGMKLELSHLLRYEEDFSKNQNTAKLESRTLKQYLRKLFFIQAKYSLNVFYQLCLKFHKFDGKNVMLMSENRPRIMDNLEAIDVRLKERGLDKEFNISYSFRNIFVPVQNPFGWLKTIYKISKQDYIFVDDYVPIFQFLDIPKETTLVQVWHAGFGFKLVGYGRYGIAGSPHPIKSCHRKYDYALIGNDHLREIYSEVFGIEKEALLATGMPRLEHFLDEDKMETVKTKLYEEFPQFKDKKIITFAPTYRGGSQDTAYYDFDQLDFDEIYKYCKENNAIFIVKQHHFLREKATFPEAQKDVFYELSDYKLNDLFYVTDVLITDYSSCFYDFLLLNRPVLFFTYDKAVYSATRGVHRPIDKVAPGKVCNNFEELMDALKNEDYGSVEAAEFLQDKCLTNDKIASDKVIDYVLLKQKVDDICMQ